MRRMNLLSLSIELPSLFTLAESLSALLFGRFDLFLDLCPNVSRGSGGSFRRSSVRAAYGFRFPLTDSLPHEGRAIRLSHITALHKQVNDRDITPIVIDLKFPASK